MFSFKGSRPPRPTDKPRPTMQTTLVTGGTLLVAPVSGFSRPSTLKLALLTVYPVVRSGCLDESEVGGVPLSYPYPLFHGTILPQVRWKVVTK